MWGQWWPVRSVRRDASLRKRRVRSASLIRAAAFIVALGWQGACAVGDVGPDAWRYEAPDPAEHWDKDCSGVLAFNGCDDCNQCTVDNWCDPDKWTGFIPPWCARVASAGVAVCVHDAISTPERQTNDCFPIDHAANVKAGKCCLGACVDNGATCNPSPDPDPGLPN